MFDTYQSIKDLRKEGKFTEQQAASIVKVISSNTEQNLANLVTKEDLAKLETTIVKWMFGMFIAFGGAITTAMFYAIKYMPAIQQVISTH